MTGICFYYEDSDVDVWSGKKLDAWHYAVKAAGDIDHIIIINLSQRVPDRPSLAYKCEIVKCLDVARYRMSGRIAQVVCPWEFENRKKNILWDFNHDIDWYIFGPAAGWQGQTIGGAMVTIPVADRGSLHACHVATTVLTHRYGVIK